MKQLAKSWPTNKKTHENHFFLHHCLWDYRLNDADDDDIDDIFASVADKVPAFWISTVCLVRCDFLLVFQLGFCLCKLWESWSFWEHNFIYHLYWQVEACKLLRVQANAVAKELRKAWMSFGCVAICRWPTAEWDRLSLDRWHPIISEFSSSTNPLAREFVLQEMWSFLHEDFFLRKSPM